MKKYLSIFMALMIFFGSMASAALADSALCETFDDDAALTGLTTAGSPTLSIAADPTDSTNKTLRYTVGVEGVSFIKNAAPIAADPDTAKVYNVGFDLYVPSDAFDSSKENGYITLNILNESTRYATIHLDNGSSASPGHSYPTDEWFRVVYSFNFCEGTYEAYYVKNDNTRTQLINSTNASFAAMTGGGIKDIRIWAGGAGNTVYVDNFGLLSTLSPSIKTGDFEPGGSPALIIANDPADSANKALRYTVGSGGVSFIRNKIKPIVSEPDPTTIYNVGFDLYVPYDAFVSSEPNGYMMLQINTFEKALTCCTGYLDNGAHSDISGQSYPTDEWFRVVYSFNFSANKYEAYYIKQDSTRTQMIEEADIPTSVTANGIQDMRLWMGGAGNTVYVNNYGLQSTEKASIGINEFDAAGAPTLVIEQAPADSANKVLQYTVGSDGVSWIRNKTKPIVSEPESSKIYNVGFDLYVPSSFDSSKDNGHMMLQVNTSTKPCCLSYLDNGTHTGISGTSYPTDEWFRVVYSFNFRANKYDAYYIKQDSTRTQLIEEAAIPASVTDNGIQDIRLWMGGAGNTVYVNNYGLQSTEEAGPVETPVPTPIPTPAPNFEIHDFEDGTWTDSFISANMDGAVTVDAPAGVTGKALEYNTTSDRSWIKNKTSFGGYKTGKWEVGADVYVPSGALSTENSYIQFMLNNTPGLRLELVPQGGSGAEGGDFITSAFPRDKWFRVRFVFDLDNNKYNTEIVQDGKVITRQFTGLPASSVTDGNGLQDLRLYRAGTDTFYVDNFGISEYDGEINNTPSVSFIRIDGLNAAGEELSIYGDFTNGASASDLTDITWQRCDEMYGEYREIADANGVTYTPSAGGFFVKVSAEFVGKLFESVPVYIHEAVTDKLTVKPYLSYDEGKLKAAVMYINEGDECDADIIVGIYDNGVCVENYMKKISIPNGNDADIYEFETNIDMTNKTVKLFVWDSVEKLYPLCRAAELSQQL